MATKTEIADKLAKLLPEGVNPADTFWDCHGTWVMLHRYIELIASYTGIETLESSLEHITENSAVIRCKATNGDRTVTTFGEAAPKNCKIAFPVAMAEKRAFDRAVLKLINIHGDLYSEDEIEADQGQKPKPEPKPEPEKVSNSYLINGVPDHLVAHEVVGKAMQKVVKIRMGTNLQGAWAEFTKENAFPPGVRDACSTVFRNQFNKLKG